jgi:hypothetical protein
VRGGSRQGNPRLIYTLLFRAAAETLLAFGRDPTHLGGTIGVTAILHTWSQTLTQHVHVHCLVTAGALSRDRARWIRGRASFFVSGEGAVDRLPRQVSGGIAPRVPAP